MDRFQLLSPGPDNPLLRFDLRPGISAHELILAAAVICLFLGHVVFTDTMRGRLIYNTTTAAIAAISLSICPLIFNNPVAQIGLGLAGLILPLFLCFLGGMGMGDIKLYLALSPIFGLATVALWFVAAVLTVLYSVPIMVRTRRAAKAQGEKLPKGQRLGSAPAGPGIAYAAPLTLLLAGLAPYDTLLILLAITAGFAFCQGLSVLDARGAKKVAEESDGAEAEPAESEAAQA